MFPSRSRVSVHALLVALVALAGCSLDRTGLGVGGGGFDGGVPPDGNPPPDGDVPFDSGGADATAPDGGPLDADLPDGIDPIDAGPPDAGPPDAGPPDTGPIDSGCMGAAPTCMGDALVECLATGELSTTSCPLGCSTSGGAHCRAMRPSNVDPALFTTTGDIVISSGETIDTTACTFRAGTTTPVPQGGGAPELCVLSANSLTIEASGTLRATGSRALVLLATTDVLIRGRIDVAARGTMAGPGALTSGGTIGGNGEHGGTYSDGGGGGGGLCGSGGDGGDVDSGRTRGGTGGSALSSWDLVPLHGGGRGGIGGTGASAGAGGGGGGAVQISARGSVQISGMIMAGGGGGAGGGDGTGSDWNIGAGGGGGAGGAVLIEAPVVTFAGGALRATGGGGGGGAGCRTEGDGQPGADGLDRLTAATGGARGPSCWDGDNYGGRGGDSGAGPALSGADGANNGSSGGNGGGGGGGVGCLLVRTGDGSAPAGIDPSQLSPSISPAYRVITIAVD